VDGQPTDRWNSDINSEAYCVMLANNSVIVADELRGTAFGYVLLLA